MAMTPLRVVPRQEELDAEVLGHTVVVIDALRATSTIVTALAHGAVAVYPCATADEARLTAADIGGGCLLCGEADSLKVAGFDLGNSPLEYVPEAVSGREMVLVTGNGTRALRSLPEGVSDVVLASFLNAGAVGRHLARAAAGGVTVVCSGTQGGFSLEDFLCAGCLVDHLAGAGASFKPDDFALAARDAFRQNRERLAEVLSEGRHARRLKELGLAADVPFCARLDVFPIIPTYRRGRIVAL